MTSNTDKFRSLFLAALMVVSVFGATAAFAGSAAAVDAEISAGSATDIGAGINTDTTDVGFTINISDGETEEVVINTSALRDEGVTISSIGTVAFGGTGMSVSSKNVLSNGDVSVNLTDSDGATGTDPASQTVTVPVNVNTSSANVASSLTLQIDDEDTTTSPDETPTLNIDGTTDLAASASPTTGESTSTQTLTFNQTGDTTVGTLVISSSDVDYTDASNVEVTADGLNSGNNISSSVTPAANSVTVDITDFDLSTATGPVTVKISDTVNPSSDTTVTLTAQDDSSNDLYANSTALSVTSKPSADENLQTGGTYWQGQELFFQADSGPDTYQIRERDTDASNNQGTLVTEFEVNSTGVKVIDTATLTTGRLVLVDESGNTVATDSTGTETGTDNTAYFEITTQDLTTEFADDSVDNSGGSDTTDLEVTSTRGTFDLVVSAELDGDAVAASDLNDTFVNGGMAAADVDVNSDDDEVTITTGADDTVPMNFSGLDGGDYDFTFAVDDTSAEDTDNITVNDIGDGEAGFAETSVEADQGDVAEITVEFTEAASSGTLLIGNEESDGYQANVSVTDGDDDGEVTVYFNTFTAGMDDGTPTVWADQTDEDDVANLTNDDSDEENLSDILDTGNYELAVSTSDDTDNTLDEPDGVGTLYVQERSTDAINLWTASSSNADDLETVGDVSTAVDDGELTESDTFAKGDAAVIQITASGLEGMAEASSDGIEDGVATDGFTAWLGGSDTQGYNLTATQLAPGNNQDPNTLDFSTYGDENMTVFYDEASDNYYVVLDTDQFADNFETEGDGDLADGDEFELNFELQDKRLLDYEDGLSGDDLEAEYDTLSTEFTVEDRTASFDTEEIDDTDYVTVEAAEGQVISGETNVAPGSEVRIRAQGAGDARFVKEQTELTVQDDGTFSAEFDFSDRAVDEEFEATLRGAASATADGIIVEAEEEVTTTEPTTTEPTTTEPTTTEPTTTEQTTEETTEETTTTSQQTPGFGIAVAMLALIGAALIALRRKD